MHACMLSRFSPVQLFVALWTAAYQALLPMELSRQEYWSGVRSPPPEDVSHPGTELRSPALEANSLPLSHQGRPCVRIDRLNLNRILLNIFTFKK